MKKILLIGCGHMGSALINTWAKSKKYSITVIEQKKSYKKKFNNLPFYNNVKQIEDYKKFDFIIIAVRPIDLESLIENIKNKKFKKNLALISVVAGKKIKIFEKNFKNIEQIIRIMPNMPALIGQGMNCMIANKKTKKKVIFETKNLFSLTGKTIVLDNENQVDMATAVSGSGPGFIFNLIDAMEKAAINLGFNKKIAKTLVSETFKGTSNLYINNKLSAEQLVEKVATKGGTTDAGLKIMKKQKIHSTFKNTLIASYNRAKQQGR